MAGTLRLPRPTDNWARALLAPFLIFVATATDRNYQTDLWHHLARGRAIVERGELVDRDLFTFTVADRPLQDVNWLTQVGYHLLYEAGGLALVQVLNSLLIAVTLGWLVRLCRRRTGSDLAAVLDQLDGCELAHAYTVRVESLRDLIELYNREVAVLEREIGKVLDGHDGQVSALSNTMDEDR